MLRRPFFPGDNYIDQLTIICDKLGKPKEEELTFVSTEKAGPAASLLLFEMMMMLNTMLSTCYNLETNFLHALFI